MTLKELRALIAKLFGEAKAITDKAEKENRNFTADESTAFKAKMAEYEAAKERLIRAEMLEQEERSLTRPKPPAHDAGQPGGEGDEEEERSTDDDDEERETRTVKPKADKRKLTVIPSSVRMPGTLRHFKVRDGISAEIQAYRFGVFLAAARGLDWAKRRAKDLGIELRLQSEGDDSKGGVLVPQEFDSTIIDLRLEYGVFRRCCKLVPMRGDSKTIPVRASGLTAYHVGEGETITESTKQWGRITLTAKKVAALTKLTNELDEDAIISMADDAMEEIGYAFAVREDMDGFYGDGTSAYGGITGVIPKIMGLSNTIANIASAVVSSGSGYASSYGAIVRADFHKVKAKLPTYARRAQPLWYMHPSFYYEVAEKIAYDAGGVTAMEVLNGVMTGRPMFLGYPVEFVENMPFVPAIDQPVAMFGSLPQAAKFGDRRGVSLAWSDSALNTFENDEIALRGTERYDINVHAVGNASGTAADRRPGPIILLVTAHT